MLTILISGCSRAAVALPVTSLATSPTSLSTQTTTVIPPTATPLPVLSTVDVVLPGVLDTLDPLLGRSAPARAIASLVFSGLVTPGVAGQFRPDLAATWSSADGLTWTFHLDPRRRWQDGAAVTSGDVTYTVGLIKAVGSPVDPALREAWQAVQVAAPDAETVVLTVPASIGADVLDLATVPILPAHLLAATPLKALALLPFSSHPIGSGTYRVTSANSLAVTLVLAEQDDLAPRQLRISVSSGPMPTPVPAAAPGTGTLAVLGAHADTTAGTTVRAMLTRPAFVFLNTRDGVLADVQVRRALSEAINRQQLVAGPLQGAAVPLGGPIATGMDVASGAADVPGSDVATAAATLQRAGWLATPGNGRARQGVRLAVTLLVDDDATRLAVAQAVARDWQTVGVETTVEKVGLDGLLRDYVIPGRFQAALLGVQQQGVLPDLAALWHAGGTLNVTGWNDPLADAALDATQSADPDTRRVGYLRFVQRFGDELPAIPLYQPTVRYAVSGIRLTVGALNDPADILRTAPTWRALP